MKATSFQGFIALTMFVFPLIRHKQDWVDSFENCTADKLLLWSHCVHQWTGCMRINQNKSCFRQKHCLPSLQKVNMLMTIISWMNLSILSTTEKVDKLNRLINVLLNVVDGRTHILHVKVFAVKMPENLCDFFKIQLAFSHVRRWRGMYFVTFCFVRNICIYTAWYFQWNITSYEALFKFKTCWYVYSQANICPFSWFHDILYIRLYFWVVPDCLKAVHSVIVN